MIEPVAGRDTALRTLVAATAGLGGLRVKTPTTGSGAASIPSVRSATSRSRRSPVESRPSGMRRSAHAWPASARPDRGRGRASRRSVPAQPLRPRGVATSARPRQPVLVGRIAARISPSSPIVGHLRGCAGRCSEVMLATADVRSGGRARSKTTSRPPIWSVGNASARIEGALAPTVGMITHGV
jgi:hypothetical protein